jgi:[phosphatase 2A protein]-leucine-carboxy methyltransferase
VVKQIVSLGAGTDTRYFRLAAANPSLALIYHEIDFPINTRAKISTIKQTPALLSVLSAHSGDPDSILIAANGEYMTSPTLNIHAIDLRTISPSSLPTIPNLHQNAPTLLLSECCLIYLTPEHNAQILTAFTQHLLPAPAPLALVLYEPIRPNDPFGRTMVANLASRGIRLLTLQRFEDLAAQRARLKTYGFEASQRAADTEFLWRTWVGEGEKARVAECEMLDEVEEWVLLAKHYCVAWGFREPPGAGVFEEAWADLEAQQNE